MTDTPDVGQLDELRAEIDRLDHALIDLLNRRYERVAHIARYKRVHGRPIRDFAREREIIEDRSAYAAGHGLSAEFIESLYRLILWQSRDRQAALKAELPMDIESKRVAIIGGNGAMGRCLAALFAELGHNVIVADLDTELSPDDLARRADVVIISVPIDVTVDVIERVAPLVRPDSLLMDVTSVKRAPMAAMLQHARSSVVGTHPLFGPSVHSLQGQRVVMCRGRGDEWFDWLRTMFSARGLLLKEALPDEHDQAMSIVQVLTHFSTEVLGRTLARLGVSIDETLKFTSPVYLLELIMTARHFAQSPRLYAAIQMNNPRAGEVANAYLQSCTEMRDTLAAGDFRAFEEFFRDVQTYFGGFTEQAMAQSSFLIDRLVERA